MQVPLLLFLLLCFQDLRQGNMDRFTSIFDNIDNLLLLSLDFLFVLPLEVFVPEENNQAYVEQNVEWNVECINKFISLDSPVHNETNQC